LDSGEAWELEEKKPQEGMYQQTNKLFGGKVWDNLQGISGQKDCGDQSNASMDTVGNDESLGKTNREEGEGESRRA